MTADHDHVPPSWDDLERYLAGELPAEVAHRISAYLASHPDAASELETLRSAVDLSARMGDSDPAQAWEQLVQRMDKTSPGRAREGRPLSRRTQRGRAAYAVTAVAALLCVVAIVVFNWQTRSRDVSVLRTYATNSGQRATVKLTDGSIALLGPATTLSVSTDPSKAGIDVRVVGQALFTVQHSSGKPFQVRAGNAIARVLGTTFMVRQYATDNVVRVLVTDGRVSLSGASDSSRGTAAAGSGAVLTANTLGTIDDSGAVQVTRNVAADDYTGWTTGKLVFRDTPARDVVLELARAYGAEVRIADSAIASQRIDATIILARRSLADVLASLTDVLDAHLVHTGRIITLMPGRSTAHGPVNPHSISHSESTYGR